MDRQTTRTHTQLRRAQRKAAKARKGQGQKPGRQTPPKTTVQKSWTPRLAKVEAVVTDDSSTILAVIAAWCATSTYKSLVGTISTQDYRKAFEAFAASHDHDEMAEFNRVITRQRDLAFTTIATSLATHAIVGLTVDVFAAFGLTISSSEKETLKHLDWLRKETGKVVRVAFGRKTSRDSVFSALIQVPEEQMLKLEGSTTPKSSPLSGISLVEALMANASSPISQLKGYCGYENRIAKLQSGIGGSQPSNKKLQAVG